MPLILSSTSQNTNSTSGGAHFVASGTEVRIFKHKQELNFKYEIVTYASQTANWPPNAACTTLSAVKLTDGHIKTVQSLYDYAATGTVGVYEQQTFVVSSYEAGILSGLGASGTIYSENAGVYSRAEKPGDEYYWQWENIMDGYYGDRAYLIPLPGIPTPGSDTYADFIVDGRGYGVPCADYIRQMLGSILHGEYIQGPYLGDYVTAFPKWREDLVLN
tara:strand:- start:68 stop:721 length:654 start_codon:yes stop_codon:yes gene_type:complete